AGRRRRPPPRGERRAAGQGRGSSRPGPGAARSSQPPSLSHRLCDLGRLEPRDVRREIVETALQLVESAIAQAGERPPVRALVRAEPGTELDGPTAPRKQEARVLSVAVETPQLVTETRVDHQRTTLDTSRDD